jgi:uncharacterized membrane protein
MEEHKFRIFDEGLRKEHLYSPVRFYSPWLLIFTCLSFLGILSFMLPDEIEYGLSRITLIYVFLGSFVITAPFYFVFVRFLAEKHKTLSSAGLHGILVSLITAVCALAVACGGLLLFFSNGLLIFNISVIILFIVVSGSWLLLLFLNSSPRFLSITAGYFLGGSCALLLGLAGNALAGPLGLINFTCLGFAAIFFALWYLVAENIKLTYTFNAGLFSYIRKRPYYMVLGLVIVLGLIMDKVVFWSVASSKLYNNIFVSFAPYETSIALAFLTAIPPVIYFVLGGERKIFEKSRRLYEAISLGAEHNTVDTAKKDLVEYLLKVFFNILKIQLTAVFSVNYLATQIFSIFKLPLENVILFRTALWGVACFVLVSFIITFLLYWDFKKQALFLCLLFLIANTCASFLVAHLDHKYATYGFSFSCLLTLAAALTIAAYIIKNLVYVLFKSPPIAQKFKIVKGMKAGNYLIRDGKRI